MGDLGCLINPVLSALSVKQACEKYSCDRVVERLSEIIHVEVLEQDLEQSKCLVLVLLIAVNITNYN